MQMSQRAKRMERRNEKGKRTVTLNLVSLMDIFTILVFFLLVNSAEVEVLPNARDIQLPESIAEEKARENVVVMVTDDQILGQCKMYIAALRLADRMTRPNNRS